MNELWVLFIFLAAGVAVFFVLRTIEQNIGDRAELTPSLFDDFAIVFIRSLKPLLYGLLLVLLGTYLIEIPQELTRYRDIAVLLLATYQVILTTTRVGRFLIKHSTVETKEEQKIYNVFSHLLSFILWVIGGLFILSNLGVNITALLAGFGIGGLAVAFALQNILKDLFSYMTILLDEPIKEGDNIEVAGQSGKVKHIGIKTTKLVTPGGEGIVVSNNTLTTEEVLNYGVAKKRRVKVSLHIDNATEEKSIRSYITSLREMITDTDSVELQEVYINDIKAEGTEIKILYFVKNRKMELYRETKTDLLAKAIGLAKKHKVEIYQAPTRS